MRTLLEENSIVFRPGQIRTLIEQGRLQGLATAGVIAFVLDKIEKKRRRNDPVFSIQLLIRSDKR